MEKVKVEIRLLDGEWQWLGSLTKKQLEALRAIADTLSDMED